MWLAARNRGHAFCAILPLLWHREFVWLGMAFYNIIDRQKTILLSCGSGINAQIRTGKENARATNIQNRHIEGAMPKLDKSIFHVLRKPNLKVCKHEIKCSSLGHSYETYHNCSSVEGCPCPTHCVLTSIDTIEKPALKYNTGLIIWRSVDISSYSLDLSSLPLRPCWLISYSMDLSRLSSKTCGCRSNHKPICAVCCAQWPHAYCHTPSVCCPLQGNWAQFLQKGTSEWPTPEAI